MMISGSLSSARRNLPAVSTTVTTGSYPARRTSATISSASGGRSSATSRRSDVGTRVLRGSSVEHYPIAAERTDRPEVLVDVDGFDDKAVDAQGITGGDVLRLGRGGQHHDRHLGQPFRRLQLAQHLDPVHPRHLD